MRRIVTFFLLLFSSGLAFSVDLSTVDGATDSLVSSLIDSDAKEYRKARQIHYPKGVVDIAIVFFTIEAFNRGNNATQYLAVFEPSFQFDETKGELQERSVDNILKYRLVGYLPVGGNDPRRGCVDFSQVILDKKLIKVRRKDYDKSDALCCPSRFHIVTYRIEDRGLYEEKPNPTVKRDAP